jgi:2-octaprenylphenol hydroxylase
MQTTDVIIVGAGSAGLTLALLLAQAEHSSQLQITVLDQGAEPVASPPSFQRVSALNLASERLLQQLGVWSALVAKPAYQAMQVWEADSFARIAFDAVSEGQHALGFMVDNEELRQQLYQKAKSQPQIQCRFGVRITQIHASEQQNLLTLADGSLYLSKLLVGADGAESQVRKSLQLTQNFWDYDHHAVVATIRTELPHQATARQVFLPTGPLALLPLADPQLCSIVWSTAPQQAAELCGCDEGLFNQQLTAATQSVLGVLQLESQRASYPLKMRYARQWQRQHAVLVADAAHTIHPLAGQGMNLGLMDVAALAELIDQQMARTGQPVDHRMLRQYERWRKAEAQQLIAAMELFKRGFMAPQPVLKLVRAVGMKLTDQLPAVKRKIMAAALGNQGDLPLIARPQLLP